MRAEAGSYVDPEGHEVGGGATESAVASRVRRRLLSRGSRVRLAAVVAIVVISVVTTPHIFSGLSLKSMFVIGGFLGIVSLGQVLCVLLGGIDLSIPFLIGVANIGTLWLIDRGLPSWSAVFVSILLCMIAGALNGYLSSVLSGQSIVVSLGIGYLFLGGADAITSIGSSQAGSVFGNVPSWIGTVSSVESRFLGLPVPTTGVIWLVVCGLAFVWLKWTWLGRGVYAVGGNLRASRLLLVRDRLVWTVVFSLSGALSGVVGVLLLGFSGGAVSDVGMPYLFLTVAAVAVGGSSLAGGRGGIGLTIVGVVVLTLLDVVLLSSQMSDAMQQVVLGLIIVPAVAAYGRASHPRMRL